MRAMRDALHAVVVLSVVLGTGLFGSTSFGQEGEPPREAVEAARRGRALFDSGRAREAIVELQAAYDLFPVPTLLHNIGRCYEEIGNACEASSYYRRFLREGTPQGDLRAGVVRSIGEQEDLCREEGGGSAGSSPEGPDPPDPGDLAPPTTFGGEGGVDDGGPARLFGGGSARPTAVTSGVGWALTSVGGAAVLAGSVMWILSYVEYARRTDVSADCREHDTGDEQVCRRTTDWAAHESNRESYALAGDLMVPIGVAALLGGVLYLVYGPRESSGPVVLGLAPRGPGFGLALSWR